MRVAYCLNSISYTGGIEKITIAKAGALADLAGIEVYIVVTDCPGGFEAASGRLSPNVRLVNLAVDYYADDWKSGWHILKGILFKRRLHKKRLTKVLGRIRPDVVVSVGQSEKYMLPEIKGRWVCIRELHFVTDYRRTAAASGDVFRKISARLSDFYEYHHKIHRYDWIVTLTREDQLANWKKSDKVSVIPNMLIADCDAVAPLTGNRVVAAGRLTAQKNFSALVRAFRMVVDRHSDWTLDIYGDGEERSVLQNLIRELRLERNVRLCGITSRLQQQMLASSVLVSSSVSEGFGMVIAEAMSCGLPVVSFACPCGPRDLIEDGKEGFLVPVGDEQMLAEKICYLIEHPGERAEMGAAARKKAACYKPEKIIPVWRALFERLVQEKQIGC